MVSERPSVRGRKGVGSSSIGRATVAGRRPLHKGLTLLATTALIVVGWVGLGSPASAAGETWTHLAPATSPPALQNAAMAYDPDTSTLVLFGGEPANFTVAGDTWTYDGTTWADTVPNSADTPSAREGTTMAYDPAIGKIVLFGGYGETSPDTQSILGDMWTYDASDSPPWTKVSDTGPPARDYATMAYDSALGKIVLFGGYGFAGTLGDTWTYDPADTPAWTDVTATSGTGPLARTEGTMAYDPAIGKVVLFGGYSDDGQYLADTWTYDGTWQQVSPTGSPSGRVFSAMAYYPGTQVMVLFGGLNSAYNDLSDTWTYDGGSTTWTQQSLSGPSGRYGAAVALDGATGQVVLFGGASFAMQGRMSDTWAYGVPSVTAPHSPAAPSATTGNGQVALSWTAPADGGSAITGYTVAYRETTSFGSWTTRIPSPATATSVTVTGLTNGTSYDFKVLATNAIGSSDYSPVTSATPSTVPSAPAAPGATPGNGLVDLSWTAPATGGSPITGYTVAYQAAGVRKWTTTTPSPADATSMTVTGLTNNTTYSFKVLATNANGSGPYSPVTTAKPVAENAPATPSDVSANAVISGRDLVATVSWSDSGPAATDHQVAVYLFKAGNKRNPDGTYTLVDTVTTGTSASSYEVGGLSLHKTYAFSVSAGNADGWSPFSEFSNTVSR